MQYLYWQIYIYIYIGNPLFFGCSKIKNTKKKVIFILVNKKKKKACNIYIGKYIVVLL
jgi:hypothetical protein